MIEEVLAAQEHVLQDMLTIHDTEDFMRRLAGRIEQEVKPAPRRADPLSPSPSFTSQSHRSTRPATRKLRRRPTSVISADPAVQPTAVRDHVGRLCETVLRADNVGTLMAAFDTSYDEAGARAFACLLYLIGRTESSLYWWRFAAGAGDALAAHLLAAHHAAAGTDLEARIWHVHARLLGYRSTEHLPGPVHMAPRTDLRPSRPAPHSPILREFMDRDRLPEALLQH